MDILKRAAEAHSNLQNSSNIADDQDEVEQLNILQKRLDFLNDKIINTRDTLKKIKAIKVRLTPLPKLKSIQESTEKFSNRFSESSHSSSVLEGKKFSSFYEEAKSSIADATESVKNDWYHHFASHYVVRDPKQRALGILLHLGKNQEAMEKYEELYNEIMDLKTSIPNNKGDLNRIETLVKKLPLVKFEENIPENVKKLFNQARNGANLEYLTDDVMAWLRENNQLSSFKIYYASN